eukprot:GHVL01004439.1.p1 GENE.GHVL01004439.1~~GHVL01004439.1.p1  ORF type:complete len:205 (+),score=30.15 GHVL01004439.1:22-636(+)
MAIKLSYFDMGGRAEAIRVCFAVGGVKFEDERIQFPDWPAKKTDASSFPLHQCPVLKVGDEVFTQSLAILRFAGVKSKLYPTDALEVLKTDEILCLIDDALIQLPKKASEEEKEKLRREYIAGPFDKYMTYLETKVAKYGGPFLTGKNMTIADIFLLGLYNFFSSGFFDHIGTKDFDKYPKLLESINKTKSNKHVVEYYKANKN